MPLNIQTNISLAPLQGFTDRIYRTLHARHFKRVDRYFIPYIEFQNDGNVKRAHQRDVQIIEGVEQVPQVLCNSFDHLFRLSMYLKELGYSEVNLNLGCPYPMVAKRKKGSGLLPFPDEIKILLQEWFTNPPLDLSIKLRLGYENPNEIYPVLEVLNLFPLKEIILHPRIGKDLYKGSANIEDFEKVNEYSKHPLTYNGDIDSSGKFQIFSKRFITTGNWMIGRGILSNPFLAEEIKQLDSFREVDKNSRLKIFLEDLWEAYELQYGQPAQSLNKMKQHWIYLAESFENPVKVFKMIKKSNKTVVYKQNVRRILEEF
ncbi:MAG: tRNA-dihydrouridine synthase family protein [Bacteroidales bacterium]|nr:tRNA-dihydrouridine synthase family protein [Bacteroidales bacterium]MCF8457114.1 tRNA-dihydrouridine synthase family protein [Bacteroidales bacterium]